MLSDRPWTLQEFCNRRTMMQDGSKYFGSKFDPTPARLCTCRRTVVPPDLRDLELAVQVKNSTMQSERAHSHDTASPSGRTPPHQAAIRRQLQHLEQQVRLVLLRSTWCIPNVKVHEGSQRLRGTSRKLDLCSLTGQAASQSSHSTVWTFRTHLLKGTHTEPEQR